MYTRVSTKGQVKDGYGLPIQEADCRAWAKAAGHTIVKHCSDDGISGTLGADVVDGVDLDQRPGLRCALDALEAKQAAGLLIPRMDRLGRATHVYAADQGEILCDDPDDPMRTAMRKMAGIFAELDRAMAVKRMRDGRLAKAAAGKHAVGVYPYGSRAGGEGKDRDAVPHEGEQAAVALIVRLRREGKSYREITAALAEAGMAPRNGRTWYPSTVRKIAQREGLS
jgi:DNA invertase Pin-like site-specific DNA recombinase